MDHLLKCHDIVKTDFVRGENACLYDRAGNRFLDFESGIWSAALGHCHPRITRIIQEQTAKVIHLGTRYPSHLAEDAAAKLLPLVGMAGGKCVFLSSGSEAVEFAAQAVRRISGKKKLAALSNSYLAAYGSAGRKEDDEWVLLDGQAQAPSPCPIDPAQIPEVGGFVLEPGGSGSTFVHFPTPSVVVETAAWVKGNGGFLVANEVTTGMGRTGRWFGYQHYDFQPDLVAFGKGLGNGYPVSAVAMSREVAAKLESTGLRYAQSHQNDPLGCAVVNEVIDVFREGDWVERGDTLGRFFLEGLTSLQASHSGLVKNVRGRGLLLALELLPHREHSVGLLYEALLKRGFIVGFYPQGNIIRLNPPLTIEKEKVSLLLEALDSIFSLWR